jgi:hypothetical protein
MGCSASTLEIDENSPPDNRQPRVRTMTVHPHRNESGEIVSAATRLRQLRVGNADGRLDMHILPIDHVAGAATTLDDEDAVCHETSTPSCDWVATLEPAVVEAQSRLINHSNHPSLTVHVTPSKLTEQQHRTHSHSKRDQGNSHSIRSGTRFVPSTTALPPPLSYSPAPIQPIGQIINLLQQQQQQQQEYMLARQNMLNSSPHGSICAPAQSTGSSDVTEPAQITNENNAVTQSTIHTNPHLSVIPLHVTIAEKGTPIDSSPSAYASTTTPSQHIQSVSHS